jgi:hypothetical protein
MSGMPKSEGVTTPPAALAVRRAIRNFAERAREFCAISSGVPKIGLRETSSNWVGNGAVCGA